MEAAQEERQACFLARGKATVLVGVAGGCLQRARGEVQLISKTQIVRLHLFHLTRSLPAVLVEVAAGGWVVIRAMVLLLVRVAGREEGILFGMLLPLPEEMQDPAL